MKNLLLLLLVFGGVAVLILWAAGDALEAENAPRLAEAQARIAEAEAQSAEAWANASVESNEETLAFLLPPTMVCLTLVTVIIVAVLVMWIVSAAQR